MKSNVMCVKDRHYMEMALSRFMKLSLAPFAVDIICDLYEGIKEKSGKFSLDDLCKIEASNKQKHSILLSLVPDWYWDVD